MQQHHRDAIERWAEAAAADDEVLAVVMAGSQTRGYGLAATSTGSWSSPTMRSPVAEPAASSPSSPPSSATTRVATLMPSTSTGPSSRRHGARQRTRPDRRFLGAIVPWSSDPSIDARVHAQAQAAQWYVGEAAKRDDPYLAGWAASRLALFASRRVLAHNQVLYPDHKWLVRTVAEVSDRPDDFLDLVGALAIERTPAAAEAVVMSLLLFREWPQAPAGWSTQVMLDSE